MISTTLDFRPIMLSVAGLFCITLTIMKGARAYIPEETECPHRIHPHIFSTEYWVLPGVPYRAWRTLPWKMFSIRQSSVPEAGMGVFANTFIPHDTWLGEYEGEMINLAQSKDLEDFIYAWRVYTDDEVTHYVDAKREHLSNWLRFINCPRHVSEESVLMHTCYGKVYYRTNVDILPGQELFVYYGDGYARDTLGVDVKNFYNKSHIPSF